METKTYLGFENMHEGSERTWNDNDDDDYDDYMTTINDEDVNDNK